MTNTCCTVMLLVKPGLKACGPQNGGTAQPGRLPVNRVGAGGQAAVQSVSNARARLGLLNGYFHRLP